MVSINLFSPRWLLFEVTERIKFVILLFCSGKSIEILRCSCSAKSLYFFKFCEKKDSKAIKDLFLFNSHSKKSWVYVNSAFINELYLILLGTLSWPQA